MPDKKSPAFQFYPKQWLGDDKIMLMDWDAQGMHLHLMCISWQQTPPCCLPNDEAIIRKWCKDPTDEAWGRIWPQIKRGWSLVGSYFVQVGLLREWEKQESWREKSSKGGKHSVKSRQKSLKGWLENGSNQKATLLSSPSSSPSSSKKTTPTTAEPPKAAATARAGDAKPYPQPDPIKDPIRAVVYAYKLALGVPGDDRKWDRHNWGRSMTPAKDLLEDAGSFPEACAFIEKFKFHMENKGLSWTLETAARRAHEIKLRQGEPHANTLHRPGVLRESPKPRPAHEAGGLRKTAPAGAVFDRIRNTKDVQSGTGHSHAPSDTEHGRDGEGFRGEGVVETAED